MALHNMVRVPVPNKTYRKFQNQVTYIYYYTKFYRKDGKPRNDSKQIGKLDDETGLLIPNDNYYVYFPQGGEIPMEAAVPIEREQSVGFSMAIDHAFRRLGLDTLLKKHFGSLAESIKVIAGYCLFEGAVMSYLEDYVEQHYVSAKDLRLTDRRASELFAECEVEKRNAFFRDWIDECRSDECIVYDVTSVSTYSVGIEQAEFGYNRDHEALRQVNLGMFSGTVSKLPVYYDIYNGSLTDKTNLIPMLEKASDLGIKRAKLVMDGGFFDETRLKWLDKSGITFTVGMPSSLRLSRALLNEHREDVRKFANRTSYEMNYGALYEGSIFGIRGRFFIGLNEKTRALMLENLKNDIDKRAEELRSIKKYSTVADKSRYTDLFVISREDSKGFRFEPDEAKIQKLADNYGYFLIFTTDKDASPDELLGWYRDKDVDEKMFYQLKDPLEMYRIRTHNGKTTEGKVFCLFIALIVRSYLKNRLRSYMTINNMTMKKCFRKLEDIRMIKFRNSPARLVKAITKTQRELLNALGLDENELLRRVNSSENRQTEVYTV